MFNEAPTHTLKREQRTSEYRVLGIFVLSVSLSWMKKTLILLLAFVFGGLYALYQGGPDAVAASDAGESALKAWMAEIDRDIESREVTAATRELEWDRVVTLQATQDILRPNQGNPGFRKVVLERIRVARQKDSRQRSAGEGYLPFLFCASTELDASALLRVMNAHEVQLSDLILAVFADGPRDRATWEQPFVLRKAPEGGR